MEEGLIKPNDLIYLILDNRRKWLVKAEKGREFQTHKGTVKFNDVIGKPFGSVIFSQPYESQGYKFYVLKPLPSDYVIHMSRKTQSSLLHQQRRTSYWRIQLKGQEWG